MLFCSGSSILIVSVMPTSRDIQAILASILVLGLVVAMSSDVVAQSSSQQYYGAGGGELTGYVLGVGNHPVDWARVRAKGTGQTYQTFSGMSGVYQTRLPVGEYNVTVDASGYTADTLNVTISTNSKSRIDFHLSTLDIEVSPGSSSVINFYLIQTQVPVPEFQLGPSLTYIAVMFAAVLLIRRITRRK
jgi:hypothetical protein